MLRKQSFTMMMPSTSGAPSVGCTIAVGRPEGAVVRSGAARRKTFSEFTVDSKGCSMVRPTYGGPVSLIALRHPLPAAVPHPPRSALAHIPGDEGWPIVGRTLELLANPKGYVEKQASSHGHVYRSNAFGQTNVTLLGPAANELVLLDQQKQFSSAMGWDIILGRLFPRGLMLLDFDEHRLHRKALSVAFKAGPMRSYLAALDAGIAARVARWRAAPGVMLFYPAMKQLTLDLAATAFLGEGIGPEIDEVRGAFIDMITATIAVVRRPLPGTKMRRGVGGRKRIAAYFDRQIPVRRERGGEDLFSHLCRATHEDGALLSNKDIVNHIIFLMMAAHDTLTSSLTSLVWMLDPMRFTGDAQRGRHRFAWVHFSGGAHMCLGLHFAYMQAKCFTRHLLQNVQVTVAPGYRPEWQMWPIPRPKDGLSILMSPLR